MKKMHYMSYCRSFTLMTKALNPGDVVLQYYWKQAHMAICTKKPRA